MGGGIGVRMLCHRGGEVRSEWYRERLGTEDAGKVPYLS